MSIYNRRYIEALDYIKSNRLKGFKTYKGIVEITGQSIKEQAAPLMNL